MIEDIDRLLGIINKGVVNGRLDNSDVGVCSLMIMGIPRNVAFWMVKVKGMIAEDVLNERAKTYFARDNVKKLLDGMKAVLLDIHPVDKTLETADWKNADVDALTPEELEKMGTYMLRKASIARDVDAKEINDLIKMLDSVGALPKKEKQEKDIKQVVFLEPFNEVCRCGREVTVTERMYDEYAAKAGYKVTKTKVKVSDIAPKL